MSNTATSGEPLPERDDERAETLEPATKALDAEHGTGSATGASEAIELEPKDADEAGTETADSEQDDLDDPDQRAHLVEEGRLITLAALRMHVKNRIIVQVLADRKAVDGDDLADFVRLEGEELVREARAEAAATAKAAKLARGRSGKPRHQSDYGDGDADGLVLRSEVAHDLAEGLARDLDDAAFRTVIADEARRAAMDEMFRARMLPVKHADAPAVSAKDKARDRNSLITELNNQVKEHDREQRRAERRARLRNWWLRLTGRAAHADAQDD